MQGPQYTQMARQFFELWQKQMSSVLSDPEFLQSMMQMMQTMNMPGNTEYKPHAGAARPSSPDTAVPDDALRERLDQLDYRVRMLEKRLSRLESLAGDAAAAKGAAKPGAAKAGAKRKPAGKSPSRGRPKGD